MFAVWRSQSSSAAHVTCVLTAVFILELLLFRDLPMADLPQHASQLDTLMRWNAPDRRPDLELNLRTPYLLAYGGAWVLAHWVGIELALKLVVAFAVIANVASIAYLARKAGHERWIALLGLPTSVGYSFYFGFLSFIIAVPLATTAIALSLVHAERPNWRSGSLLFLALCATLSAHGVAFAVAAVSGGALLVRGGGSLLARAAPLVGASLGGAVWLLPGSSMARTGEHIFRIGPQRLVNLPAALVGLHGGDVVATIFGLAVLATVAAVLGPLRSQRARWVLLGVSVSGYCLFPAQLRGYGFLSERFASFLLPGLLLAFAPRREGLRRASRALALGVSCAWLLTFSVRLAWFNRESADFRRLVQRMPDGLRVRSLIFDRESRAFPGVPAFLHYTAYYHLEKGGVPSHSFLVFPNSVILLRPGAAPAQQLGSEWHPLSFDARKEAPLHDYYVVKSATDRGAELFANSPFPIRLHLREGDFWGYRRAAGL